MSNTVRAAGRINGGTIDWPRMDVKDRALWHLDRDYNRPIRDPLWSNIYISDSLFPIIDSYEFQQLSRIKQLGPSHLVYPGATHTLSLIHI